MLFTVIFITERKMTGEDVTEILKIVILKTKDLHGTV